MGKRVFLTGAAGFVGAVLARRLLQLGHEVHVPLKDQSHRWRLASIEKELRVHLVDLRDEAGLRAAVQAARPEVIFHLAAHGAYPFQNDPESIIQTNILGSWNLLKACSAIDYQVFVNTGSSSEYGFKQYAMRETDLPEPNSYYAAAKVSQTLICQHVAIAEKRPISTFRLFSAYGPFEESTRLVPTLIQKCLNGDELQLVPPQTARDFIYVDDVVDAYLRFDELSKLRGEIINIGTGVQSTVSQVVAAVLHHTGAEVKCHWGAMKPRIWDSATWVADATKSRRLLGWHAATSLSDGLGKTVAWMREQGPTPLRK
jgi:nucleoside-diphosphate-sugar epimerase